MPRKPAVEKKQKKPAAESTRPKIERVAKAAASDRMVGKLTPLKSLPVEAKKVRSKKTVTLATKLRKAGSYTSMVKRALKENVVRKGTSWMAICNYVQSNYAVKETFRRYLKAALAREIEAGTVVKKSPQRYALKKAASKKKTTKKSKKSGEPKTKTTKVKATTAKTTKAKATKTDKASPKKGARATEAKKTRATKTAPKTAPKAAPKAARGAAASSRSKAASTTESSGSTGPLIWVWQYYDNGFFNYESTASSVVEGVYQEYLTSPYTCDVRAVKSGDWEYEIDFRQMTQRNIKHAAHTTRNIRRTQIPEGEKHDRKKRYEGTPDSQ